MRTLSRYGVHEPDFVQPLKPRACNPVNFVLRRSADRVPFRGDVEYV